jgi:hypothetical protein
MKLWTTLLAFSVACASFAALGCSGNSDSNTSSSAGANSGGGSGIAPNSHDANESCPDGVSDCKAGLLCDNGDPNGQCFMICDAGKDSECGDPTKFACNSEGHCYPRCTVTSDCARAAEGYVCKDDEPPRPPVKFCDGPN